MPWPVSGSSPPSLRTSPKPRPLPLPLAGPRPPRERAAHHVRRAARRRARVERRRCRCRDRGPRSARARTRAARRAISRIELPHALAHLARRAADDVADRRALDRDRGAARRLHALEQHAQALAARVVLVADGVGGRLQALLEVHVVHDLAGGERVAVAQQVHAPQLERAHAELGRRAGPSCARTPTPTASRRSRGRRRWAAGWCRSHSESTRTFGIRYGPDAGVAQLLVATPGPQSA